jgi:multiple sugar transport system substrate-binding protein
MRMKRGFAVVAPFLLLAAACSGGGDESPTSGPGPTGTSSGESPTASTWSLAEAAAPYAGQEIRVLDEITDLQPTLEPLVQQFVDESGIQVTYELQSHFDVITNGESDLFSGSGTYDAIMLHRFQFPNAITAGAIQYIDQYMADPALHDPSVTWDSFIQPLSTDGYKNGENTICFPDWNYNQVWIGRQDLIDNADEQAAFETQYGYPLAAPTTLQQMHDFAEFFTRPAGATLAGETLDQPFYGFTQDGAALSTNWQDSWFNYINNMGGNYFDENGTPIANDAANVPGLDQWAGMFDFAPPGAGEVTLVDLPVIIGQGQVASGIGWSDFFFTLDSPGGSAVAGKLTYAPIPEDENSPDTHQGAVTASCDIINNASDNKEATFLFLQWIASQPTQDALLTASTTKGGFVPTTNASLENPEFTGGARAGLNAAIAGALAIGQSYPLLVDFPKMTDPMLQETQSVLLGDATAQEALDGLQSDITAICPSDCNLPTS